MDRKARGPMVSTVCVLALCAMLPRLAGADAGLFVPLSAYDDDPFAADAVVERLNRRTFDRGALGRLVLANDRLWIEDEAVVYRRDPATGYYLAFAWNPWAPELEEANADGTFAFPDEPRFPLHRVERDAEGKVVLREGLQVWLPQDLHRGMTTVFEGVNAARSAAELWAGRELPWGADGRLEVNAHAFIDFNAFYSPTARALFFGVVPYRLPGEPRSVPARMLETVTSWEIVVHEAGHALHATLKPNRDLSHLGYRTWSESFGDQIAMWASLRDRDRVRALLAETGGDLAQSSSLTRIGEAFAALVGEGTGLRDAFHELKVSDTSDEMHERSQVLTGAAYDVFLTVHARLRSEHGPEDALRKAGRLMGTFLMRTADHTPEDQMSVEDVAKAYLKVDKEHYGGRHHATLVDEFIRREVLDAGSLAEWQAHEAAVPELSLSPGASDVAVARLLVANLDRLGIAPDFGLWLQSVTRERLGWTIVRVQLTSGRGGEATPLDNHGILTFRPDGTLADYHPPIPPDPSAAGSRTPSPEQLGHLVAEAARSRLARQGSAPSIVRRADGALAVEVRLLRGDGMDAHMKVLTPDNPGGERREVLIPPVPANRRVPVADDVLQ